MRIAITLNENIRDLTSQVLDVFGRYNMGELDTHNISYNNLSDLFVKKSDYENFLYNEASLEIFGHASSTNLGIVSLLNRFILDTEYEEKHEITLISEERNNSIQATYFFLAKIGCKIKNIKFFHDYNNVWDFFDVIITNEPTILNSKPDDKISVKINKEYNSDCKSNLESENLDDFIENNMIEKL